MEAWKKILFPVASLFILFMVDGLITTFFNEQLYTDIGYVVPRLTVIFLLVLSFYLSPGHLFFLSILFGYFYDSYYTGYLGPFMAAFCLITYLVYQTKNILKPGILTYALVGTVMFTVLEFMIYMIYSAIGLTTISVTSFLATRLGATLLFNVLFLVAFSPLLDRFILYIMEDDDQNYQGLH